MVLTRQLSENSKLMPVARLTYVLPIVNSRELLNAHLTTYKTLLVVYLQKITFHASTSRKRPHTLPFTIEMVSMHQADA
jgi:hypothetical protein